MQMDDAARRARVHGVVDRLHAALLDKDMDAFANEWAPDGRMEFPFAPPGWPAPIGREAVRAYLAGYPDQVAIHAISRQERHALLDPDMLIVEWGVDGQALKTGRRYAVDYVAVIKVGNEGIVSYRDYWSALNAGHALGRLDEIVSAYRSVAA